VICVCEAEREVAKRVGPARRTRVVYNGIEPLVEAAPDPKVADLAQGGPLVCTVAELQAPKGVTSLIAAMPAILEAAPAARLAIAGDGVERTPIERQIAELELGERVALLGSIDNVAGLLSAADVFVQPGWSESFPYSILEAMSLGLPIVATAVGGVGEAIEDGVTGRLVPPQDAERLAAAVVDLLSNRGRANELGEAGRERMMSRFRFRPMIEKTIGVYREIGLG
jgi:glycosyltransferase involved in cell wall biosynthesis